MDRFTLNHGDCIEVMRGMADNSVDAIVTDPPYELGFMGKSWDASGIAFNVEVWSECLRILKPGGHLLAFSGSRTYHRMAVAIEDAGFEVRDQIMWLYGSGFPKSLDVGKAIDKRGGNPHLAQEIGAAIKVARIARGWTTRQADEHFCGGTTNWTWYEGRPRGQRPPTVADFARIAREWPELLPLAEAVAEAEREVIGSSTNGIAGGTSKHAGVDGSYGFAGEFDITAPATPAAQQWQGWGTALKPAHEPIVLARKPLIGTVAANVLAHGTGALNIDGCRVVGETINTTNGSNNDIYGDLSANGGEPWSSHPQGRWPANVIHDGSDEVVGLFPVTASGARPAKANKPTGEHYDGGWGPISDGPRIEYEGGSAARFFYCAKASKRDRNEGLEGFAEKVARRYGQQGQGPKAQQTPRNPVIERNHHPTVKPTDLMRYLIRLITPPGGIVLDPFMGSGSTGKAAMFEGVRFIGIEQDAEYLAIAQARIEWALAQPLEDVIFPRASELSEDEMAQLAFPIATAEGEASA